MPQSAKMQDLPLRHDQRTMSAWNGYSIAFTSDGSKPHDVTVDALPSRNAL